MPAEDLFPAETWRRLMTRRWAQHPDRTLLHGDGGYQPLREAIAQYVCTSRGLACEPEQVVIIGGERQGLDLATRVLADPGDRVWFEDPGSPQARDVLTLTGAEVVPVPVDEDGIDVAAGIRAAPDARLVHISPSAQYPLARTLTLERRAALLEWAASRNAWVLEDDRDCEFRYSGRPLPALHGMDAAERVIYLGGFSRVLAPALRVGYLVVPRSLVDVFVAAGTLIGRDVPTMEQAVLADFLAGGHFARHLRRLRAACDRRGDSCSSRSNRAWVASSAPRSRPRACMWSYICPRRSPTPTSPGAVPAVNLGVAALSDHALDRGRLNGVLVGFAGCTEPAIRYGVRRLANIVHEACDGPGDVAAPAVALAA